MSTALAPTLNTLPLLLAIPLELRHQIYSYLLPAQPTPHPLPSVAFTSSTHPPPKIYLLNVHPQLTHEILEYYYTLTTWTLVFSHAFNFFRMDPELRGLERSYALMRIRKLECVIYCDVLLLGQRNGRWAIKNNGLESFCTAASKRIHRAVDVLKHASKLHTIIISWIDTSNTANWSTKAQILAPFRPLRPQVSLQVGQVRGIDGSEEGRLEREVFAAAMMEVLGEGKRVQAKPKEYAIELDGGRYDATRTLMPPMAPEEREGSFVREVARANAAAGVSGWPLVGL